MLIDLGIPFGLQKARVVYQGKAFTIDTMERFYPFTTSPLCLLGKPGFSQCLSIVDNQHFELNQLSSLTSDQGRFMKSKEIFPGLGLEEAP